MPRNIVLVTGMSGAGKSSVMNALEDLGYYCVDNFPKELISQFPTLFSETVLYENMAFSVSALDYIYFLRAFDELDCTLRILFLDCSDAELLLRYRFTRRLHPIMVLGLAKTYEEAIHMERDFFDQINVADRYLMKIDTSKLSKAELASRVRNRFKVRDGGFTITFQSFGFKHGVPMDADALIDVRFLPNPFYDPVLREKTGNDQDVYEYVMKNKITEDFLEKLQAYLDLVFEEYAQQEKSQMIVCIGCTGGQHRSVSICNWLYDVYKDRYRAFKSHRDIGVGEI